MSTLRGLFTCLAVVCLVFACSDDTSDTSNDTNTGGAAGMAGTDNMAGSAGMPGNPNLGGEGGAATAGAAGEGGAAADEPDEDWTPRMRLLNSLQANAYTPTFTSFASSSAALRDSAAAWDADPSEGNLESVRNAWRTAMGDWQKAELMQVGPAGSAERRIGGMDYRDRIYSFPVVNSCRVDQELVRNSFSDADWVEGAQFNVRGLDAIEYLVFGLGAENTCPSVSGINRNGDWATLQNTPGELTSRRTGYVLVLAEAIVEDADALAAAWQNTEGNFGHAFVNATAPFSSEKETLDQVFAGLFYTDKFIKDLKLGKPAGITDDCASEMCVDSVESKWSASSKTNLINNLMGLKLLYFGGEDDANYGFYDLLVEENAEELANRMSQTIDAAIEAVNTIDSSVEAQLVSDDEAVRSSHAAIRAITDDLKTQFVTVLNLSVPQEGAGDND